MTFKILQAVRRVLKEGRTQQRWTAAELQMASLQAAFGNQVPNHPGSARIAPAAFKAVLCGLCQFPTTPEDDLCPGCGQLQV
jgi:hypothetical protein